MEYEDMDGEDMMIIGTKRKTRFVPNQSTDKSWPAY